MTFLYQRKVTVTLMTIEAILLSFIFFVLSLEVCTKSLKSIDCLQLVSF